MLKQRRIIMLPTRQPSIIQMHIQNRDFQPLGSYNVPYHPSNAIFQNQVVLILSNDEIKPSDYYINVNSLETAYQNKYFFETVLQRASMYDSQTIKEKGFFSCMKVIAATIELKIDAENEVPSIDIFSLEKYLEVHQSTQHVLVNYNDREQLIFNGENEILFELEGKEKLYTKNQVGDIIYDFIHSHKDVIMNGGGYNNVLSIKEWINEKGL